MMTLERSCVNLCAKSVNVGQNDVLLAYKQMLAGCAAADAHPAVPTKAAPLRASEQPVKTSTSNDVHNSVVD